MKPGDIAPMKSAKVNFGGAEFGFKAKNSRKGDRLIFMFLGHHNGDDEPFDPEQVLRNLGWIPANEAKGQ